MGVFVENTEHFIIEGISLGWLFKTNNRDRISFIRLFYNYLIVLTELVMNKFSFKLALLRLFLSEAGKERMKETSIQ